MGKYSVFLKTIIVLIVLCFTFNNSVIAEDRNFDKASILKKLGLFKGIGSSFELENSFTRAQGAIMILRLSGLESSAEKTKMKSVFIDVKTEHWTSKYINFAASRGLVKGISKNTFKPERQMNGKEFMTLALRALGYLDANPQTAMEISVSSKMLTLDRALSLTSKAVFLRDDMVEVAYAVLKTKFKQTDLTLLSDLVNKGIISEDVLNNSGFLDEDTTIDKIDKAISDKLKRK